MNKTEIFFYALQPSDEYIQDAHIHPMAVTEIFFYV